MEQEEARIYRRDQEMPAVIRQISETSFDEELENIIEAKLALIPKLKVIYTVDPNWEDKK